MKRFTFALAGVLLASIGLSAQTQTLQQQIDAILNAAKAQIDALLAPSPPPPPPPSPTPATSQPFSGTPVAIPGTIRPENFDLGGEGVGYHDTTPGNTGGQARLTDNVDLEKATGALGSYDVGWTAPGEWLAYTVNVQTAGTYTVTLQVSAAAAGGSLHLSSGTVSSASVIVPNTGGWQTWQAVTTTIALPAGVQVLKVTVDAGGFNLANLAVALSVPLPPPPPITTAGTIHLAAGANLQTALDNATCGSTLALATGATFSGNYTLKKTCPVATPITVQPEAPLGTGRFNPSTDAATVARLVSPNASPALATMPSSGGYVFRQLEITSANGGADLVTIGDDGVSGPQTTLAVVPHDFLFDRVYIHGHAVNGNKRGIALNGAAVTIANSYISDIKYIGQDSQALCGWNGPGPFTITNNYLEGAGENIIFGGADPKIQNLVPSDIVIRGNTITKPLAWKGSTWQIKNLVELKNAQRVVIDKNDMSYSWAAAQVGYAILFTVRNQDGNCSWCTVQHVALTNNIVAHMASGIQILGRDDTLGHASVTMTDIHIGPGNVFTDIDPSKYGGDGREIFLSWGPDAVEITGNTFVGANMNSALSFDAVQFPSTNLNVHDTSFSEGWWGIAGNSTGMGLPSLAAFAPGFTWSNVTILKGGSGTTYPYPPTTTVQ